MARFSLKTIPAYLKGLGARRILMTVLGVLICGFGVSMCRMARLGVDPFQCLCMGLYNVIPWPQGTTYAVLGLLLLIFSLIFRRKSIGLGTFINMSLLGYVIDGGERLLLRIFGEAGPVGQAVWLVLSIAVLCLSSSLYMTASLGISVYDSVAVFLSEKGVLPFRWMRIVTDVVCVSVGFALGYTPGISTIICALMMGPIISAINTHFSEPLLNGTLFAKKK